jgi:succinate dehydrogenase / fumarate reductase membrane anchor subunit
MAILAYGGTLNGDVVARAPRSVTMPGKNFETWSWLFMRWSGGILLLLVWIHVLTNALLTGAHSIDLQYVADRWAQPLNWGATFTILMLALLHGVNGLRAVVGDYVHNPAAVRVINAVALLGWLVLTAAGAVAMFLGVRGI